MVPNYDVTTWYGLYGPKGMPPAVIAKLNKTLNEILQEPETRDRLSKTGVIVKSSTPEAWHQFMAAEYKKWTAVREKSRAGAALAAQYRLLRLQSRDLRRLLRILVFLLDVIGEALGGLQLRRHQLGAAGDELVLRCPCRPAP